MSAKLQTIDAETLLATPLKPVPFIVDGLIPCGNVRLTAAAFCNFAWRMNTDITEPGKAG